MRVCDLEHYLAAQLNDSSRRRTVDGPERTVFLVVVGDAVIGVVESIKRLSSELELRLFSDAEVLEKRKVEVFRSWPTYYPFACVSENTLGRL